jgi:histone deacetylase 6
VNDYDYIYACDKVFFPMIREFKPDMIIVSCGFDSALGDPLGGIAVTPAGYAWMTAGLMKMAPKMMVVLEGGYNLEALAKSSYAVVQTLIIGKVNNEFVKMLKSFVK